MISSSDFALIRNLEITTKKQISGPLLGDARSNVKGAGFEFHQLRDYVQGDDIRYIDWKASARSNKMLVRQYLEDRNRTVYLVVDISASTRYGTQKIHKNDLMKQLAAILAFVSLHRKDAVGLILFSQDIEKIIPPRNSRAHVFSLVQTLFSHTPRFTQTNLAAPLNYVARLRSQKALVCFISDFMADCDATLLSMVGRRHDTLIFRCLDERETDFPDVGTLLMEDSETGKTIEVEGSAGEISGLLDLWHRHQKEQFNAAKIDSLDLIAGKPYSGDLVRFLRTRIYG